MITENVTRTDITDGLRELGLCSGDVVFLHSSLSSFGYVEGGAETVVQAFLEVLGNEGTLAVPIFRRYFWEGSDQVWDRDNSPSLMGKISEAVRTWHGSSRSHHAPHPIAAVGRLADDLTDRHNITDFSYDSPFARLIELNAWIVMLGVDYNNCTMIHLIEERAEVPYRHWVELSGTVIENGVPNKMTFPFLARYSGVENDFIPLGKRMENEGFVGITTIGKSVVKCFRSRDLYEIAMRSIRQDPLFLVSANTKEEARKYLPEYGKILDEQLSDHVEIMETEDPIALKLSKILRITRPSSPISVEIRSQIETSEGLTLEEFRLNSVIPGMIAIPQDCPEPLPAVICLHGTGGNWEAMMEQPFFSRGGDIIGWARELARRGFATIAITQFSHPPRKEPWDWEMPKLLPVYGRTAMGLLVSDACTCVDYLFTRPEIDDQRIAIGGFSLGGITAFYTFAIDARISAAFTFCGGVGSIRHLIKYGETRFHSIYYYVPDIISENLDHPQIVSAIAPRPLLVCGSTEDAGMPISGLREFEAEAKKAYQSLGAGERFKVIIEEGPHIMSMNAFETAARWLSDEL